MKALLYAHHTTRYMYIPCMFNVSSINLIQLYLYIYIILVFSFFFFNCTFNSFFLHSITIPSYICTMCFGTSCHCLLSKLSGTFGIWLGHITIKHTCILHLYLGGTITNPCDSNNGGCSQTCTSIVGSFVCSCMIGYILGADNRICNGKLFYVSLIQH